MRALVQSRPKTEPIATRLVREIPYSLQNEGGAHMAELNNVILTWAGDNSRNEERLRQACDLFAAVISDVRERVDPNYNAQVTSDISRDFDDSALLAASADSMHDVWSKVPQAEALRVGRERVREKLEAFVAKLDQDCLVNVRGDVVRITKQPPTKPQWVEELENLGSSQPDVRSLANVIRNLRTLSSQRDFAEIDRAFRIIDISKLSVEAITALLRATFHCRMRLQIWRAFLNIARKELAKRGWNDKEVFDGLA